MFDDTSPFIMCYYKTCGIRLKNLLSLLPLFPRRKSHRRFCPHQIRLFSISRPFLYLFSNRAARNLTLLPIAYGFIVKLFTIKIACRNTARICE